MLPTAIYVCKKRRIIKKYGEEGLQRAEKFIQNCNILEEWVDPEELSILKDIQNIDEGEAVLAASTKKIKRSMILTGDKRFLIVLAKETSCIKIKKRLENRCICFEQAILEIVKKQDFQKVKNKIVKKRHIDKSLGICFGEPLTKDNVLLGLTSYIKNLQKQTKGLLKKQ